MLFLWMQLSLTCFEYSLRLTDIVLVYTKAGRHGNVDRFRAVDR